MRRAVAVLPAAVGLGFVVGLVAGHRAAAEAAVADAGVAWLVLAFAAAAGAIVWVALGWTRILDVPAGQRPVFVAAFFAGELGKYVPGGIWPIVGRAEHAVRLGVERKAAYASVALSLAAVYGCAAAVASVLAAWLVHPAAAVAASAAVAALVAAVPRARVGAWYVPAWALVAVATWSVARALHASASPGRVALAAVASWIAGFAAGPVPAGVGVREAAFVALAGLPPGVGAAAALLARLAFVAVDTLGAVAATGRTGPRRPVKGRAAGSTGRSTAPWPP